MHYVTHKGIMTEKS